MCESRAQSCGAVVTSTYAVSKPASKAFVPGLVGKKQLTLANGLVQSVLWPCFFLGAGLVGGLSALDVTPGNSLIMCVHPASNIGYSTGANQLLIRQE